MPTTTRRRSVVPQYGENEETRMTPEEWRRQRATVLPERREPTTTYPDERPPTQETRMTPQEWREQREALPSRRAPEPTARTTSMPSYEDFEQTRAVLPQPRDAAYQPQVAPIDIASIRPEREVVPTHPAVTMPVPTPRPDESDADPAYAKYLGFAPELALNIAATVIDFPFRMVRGFHETAGQIFTAIAGEDNAQRLARVYTDTPVVGNYIKAVNKILQAPGKFREEAAANALTAAFERGGMPGAATAMLTTSVLDTLMMLKVMKFLKIGYGKQPGIKGTLQTAPLRAIITAATRENMSLKDKAAAFALGTAYMATPALSGTIGKWARSDWIAKGADIAANVGITTTQWGRMVESAHARAEAEGQPKLGGFYLLMDAIQSFGSDVVYGAFTNAFKNTPKVRDGLDAARNAADVEKLTPEQVGARRAQQEVARLNTEQARAEAQAELARQQAEFQAQKTEAAQPYLKEAELADEAGRPQDAEDYRGFAEAIQGAMTAREMTDAVEVVKGVDATIQARKRALAGTPEKGAAEGRGSEADNANQDTIKNLGKLGSDPNLDEQSQELGLGIKVATDLRLKAQQKGVLPGEKVDEKGVAGVERVGEEDGRALPIGRAGGEEAPTGRTLPTEGEQAAEAQRVAERAGLILEAEREAEARLDVTRQAEIDADTAEAERAVLPPPRPVGEAREGAEVRAGEATVERFIAARNDPDARLGSGSLGDTGRYWNLPDGQTVGVVETANPAWRGKQAEYAKELVDKQNLLSELGLTVPSELVVKEGPSVGKLYPDGRVPYIVRPTLRNINTDPIPTKLQKDIDDAKQKWVIDLDKGEWGFDADGRPRLVDVSEFYLRPDVPTPAPRAEVEGKPEGREEGWEAGDRVAYTGEDAPEGMRTFIFLEGHKAGQKGVATTPESREIRAKQKQAEFQETQKEFARLKPEPAKPTKKPKREKVPRMKQPTKKERATELRGTDMDLYEFVKQAGGIRAHRESDLSEEVFGQKGRGGVPLGLRNKDGMTGDEMADEAVRAGFLKEGDGERELLDLLSAPRDTIDQLAAKLDEQQRFSEDELGSRIVDGEKSPIQVNEVNLDEGTLVYRNYEWHMTRPGKAEGVAKELVDGETIRLADFESVEAAVVVDRNDPSYARALAEYREQEQARPAKTETPAPEPKPALKRAPGELFVEDLQLVGGPATTPEGRATTERIAQDRADVERAATLERQAQDLIPAAAREAVPTPTEAAKAETKPELMTVSAYRQAEGDRAAKQGNDWQIASKNAASLQRSAMDKAVMQGRPILAETWDKFRKRSPVGYTREGDLYVKGEAPPISEPYSIGQRVKMKDSPRTGVVVEIPKQTAEEVENGEVPLRVRFGAKIDTVFADLDVVPVKGVAPKPAAAAKTPDALDHELARLGMDTTAFKTKKEKQAAIKRAEAKGKPEPTRAILPTPRVEPEAAPKPEVPIQLAKLLLKLPHEQISYLSGDRHADLRQRVLEILTGEKVTKAKAGARAVHDALFKALGVDKLGKSEADRRDLMVAELQRIAGIEPTRDIMEARPIRTDDISITRPRDQTAPKPAGVAKDDAQKQVDQLADKWKNKPKGGILVVERADIDGMDISPESKQSLRDSGAEGFYDVKNDRVVIIGDNLSRPEDVTRVALHETIGHKGLRAVLGDRLDSELLRLGEGIDRTELETIAREYGVDLKTQKGMLVAVEEHIARNAEAQPTRWQSFRGFVKRMLEGLGLSKETVDTWFRTGEIDRLVEESRLAIARGTPAEGARADEIRMSLRPEDEERPITGTIKAVEDRLTPQSPYRITIETPDGKTQEIRAFHDIGKGAKELVGQSVQITGKPDALGFEAKSISAMEAPAPVVKPTPPPRPVLPPAKQPVREPELKFAGLDTRGTVYKAITETATAHKVSDKRLAELSQDLTGSRDFKKAKTRDLVTMLAELRKDRPESTGHDTRDAISFKTEHELKQALDTRVRSSKLTQEIFNEMKQQQIENIRDEMKSRGTWTPEREAELLRSWRDTPEFVSKRVYATEAQGQKLLRQIVDTEPSVMERMRLDQAALKNPVLAQEIDRVKALRTGDLDRRVKEGKAPGDGVITVKSLVTDVRHFFGRAGNFLADYTPLGNYYRIAHEKKTAEAAIDRKMRDVGAGIKPAEMRTILNSPESAKRIEDYMISNKEAVPKEMTATEKLIGDRMIEVFKEYQPTVRWLRFMEWYHDRKMVIPNAPESDLNEAKMILEVEGLAAARKFIDTKTWGVVEKSKGFVPEDFISPARSISEPETLRTGRSHLRSRMDGSMLEQDRTVFQKFSSYVRWIENHSRLQPEIDNFDAWWEINAPKFSTTDQKKLKKEFRNWHRELLGRHDPPGVLEKYIMRTYAQAALVIFNDLGKGVRNLFQIAFHTNISDVFRMRKLTPERLAYFNTFVNQTRGIQKDLMMSDSPGWKIFKPLNQALAAINVMGRSDTANRYLDFAASISRVDRALRNNPDYAKTNAAFQKLLTAAGIGDLTAAEAQHAKSLLMTDGPEAFARFMAKSITEKDQFVYNRWERGLSEQGTDFRKIASNLFVFPKGYAQRVGFDLAKITSKLEREIGGPAHVPRRAAHSIVGVMAMGAVASSLLQILTGSKRRPYDPQTILSGMFGFGGLVTGTQQKLSSFASNIATALSGGDEANKALGRALNDVTGMADTFVPFYREILRAYEGFGGYNNADRMMLRQIRSKFDDRYNSKKEYYERQRTLIETGQHVLFGTQGDRPEPTPKFKARGITPSQQTQTLLKERRKQQETMRRRIMPQPRK